MFGPVMRALAVLILYLILSMHLVFADENETEIHRAKAQQLIESKDWTSAEPEAKAVISVRPEDQEGWLLYAIIEQRLEHNAEAAKAYRKYIELSPPQDKVEAVRQRLAEVELRVEKEKKESADQSEKKYNWRSNGVFLTFSPVYQPSTSRSLNGTVGNNFQGGFQLGDGLIGFMYASGGVQSFEAAPNAAGSGAVFSSVGPASLKIYELFYDYNFRLSDPFKSTGPFSLFVPVQFGAFKNALNLNDGSRSFGNMGLDFAPGIGVEWFTHSPFAAGLSGLYHFGWSFWDVEQNASSLPVKTASGNDLIGGNSGFEFRLTLTYLFGYEKTTAEKAGVQ